MKRTGIFLLLFIIALSAQKVKYEADWASIDSRPIPEWFKDAKLGIFIHWGVYSVPAWTKKGGYAEWYWKGYDTPGSIVSNFHKKTFGENFTYEQFAPMFKAELFNPDEWTSIIKQSGAKYVVLTSKHHDGYCLWPSKQAKGWNSVDVGPKRDLVGDFMKAVRKTDIKAGLYYSLAEWTNPINMWTKKRPENDFRKYVDEYMMPQLKDLVETYKPSIVWADGEWDYDAKDWRSAEFLQWLYNESPAPEDVVVNDRWGGDSKGAKHGGYLTTEYTSGLTDTDRAWEECRGMGYSFGFNRNETLKDYKTSKELIHMLVRLVSIGGNLLLNIGPAADGRIPVIMQQRLNDIGNWLEINGTAIYSTRKWKYTNEYDWIRYTTDKNNKNVNAIMLKWPGAKLNLKRVKPEPGSSILLSGYDNNLNWKFNDKEGLTIFFPGEARDILEEKAFGAYSVTIKGGASEIADIPEINVPYLEKPDSTIFTDNVDVTINNPKPGTLYYYTTDNSEPGFTSKKINGKIKIDKSCSLKLFAYEKGKVRSLTRSVKFTKVAVDAGIDKTNKEQGLNFNLYKKQFLSCPDFTTLKPDSSGSVAEFSPDKFGIKDHFAVEYKGYIKIEKPGVYNFYLSSDDGSKLFINDRLVVNHDGLHGSASEKSGQAALSAGYHKISISYFENEYDEKLILKYSSAEINKTEINKEMLFR